MLLSHAVLLVEARSSVAALADHANTFDASMEFERVLLQLDSVHDGVVPPLTVVADRDPAALYGAACTAIRNLANHPVDPLELEICLDMLETAHDLDAPS